jgi:hypothetical protein
MPERSKVIFTTSPLNLRESRLPWQKNVFFRGSLNISICFNAVRGLCRIFFSDFAFLIVLFVFMTVCSGCSVVRNCSFALTSFSLIVLLKTQTHNKIHLIKECCSLSLVVFFYYYFVNFCLFKVKRINK